jgi:hypothetical protein
MADRDQEPSAPEAAPLRFGEILAASTMMPEFASLPLESWPEYRYSSLRSNVVRSKGPGFSSRPFTRAILRFVKITVAMLIGAATRCRPS